jgi:hypothetical protein
MQEGGEDVRRTVNGDVNYTFLNGQPNRVTQFATPYLQEQDVKAELGLYAQDRWTIKRLTLNYGVRFDYWNGSVPAQHVGATRFVPERSYAPVHGVPSSRTSIRGWARRTTCSAMAGRRSRYPWVGMYGKPRLKFRATAIRSPRR